MQETPETITKWSNETFGGNHTPMSRTIRMVIEGIELLSEVMGTDLELAKLQSEGRYWAERLSSTFEKLVEHEAPAVHSRPLKDINPERVGGECADVYIVLSQVAETAGVDLHEHTDKKMAKNRLRSWEQLPSGRFQHQRWWWAHHQDAEILYGSCDNRDAALTMAKDEDPHAEGYYLVPGKPMQLDFTDLWRNIEPKDATGDQVFELLDILNEECWGENQEGSEWPITGEQQDALMLLLNPYTGNPEALGKKFAEWAEQNPQCLPTAWMLDLDHSREEWIPNETAVD